MAARTASTTQAISGGQVDNDGRFPSVVGISIIEGGLGQCTGSLILPNLVLTARHCVSETSQEFIVCSTFRDSSTGMTYQPTTASRPYANACRTIRGQRWCTFMVTTDGSTENAAATNGFTAAAEVIVPDGTETGRPICGNDIALIRLAEPITNPDGSAPELVIPRLDLAPVSGERFTAVGYGVTSGTSNNSGTRRYRNPVLADGSWDVAVDHLGPIMAGRDMLILHENEFIATTGTCQGDSGGPAFEVVDGKRYVFGVLSRGAANSCDSPVYTRVDKFADFIRAHAREAASIGGFDPPAWVDAPPNGRAGNGEPCMGDRHCAEPLACRTVCRGNCNGEDPARPRDEQRLCVDEDCSACADGFICGESIIGAACVPDPSRPTAMPTAGDAGADGSDAGTGRPRGSCSVSPRGAGERGAARGAALSAGLAALGVFFARRGTRRIRRTAR